MAKSVFGLVNLCRRCVANSISKCSNKSKDFAFGQNSTQKFDHLVSNLNAQFILLRTIIGEQFNGVASLQLRRAYQVLQLHKRLYGEHFLLERFKTLKNVYSLRKGKTALAMLSAVAFNWEKERVSNNEIKRIQGDAEEIQELASCVKGSRAFPKGCEGWETIVDTPDFMVWRKMSEETGLYTYKVYGHFRDLTPLSFFTTQVDLPAWKVWDPNTIEVYVVETDSETKSEVVHWFYKFPYPLAPRDYVYVRRYEVDKENNSLVLTNKATNHPDCPEKEGTIRVEVYTSQMVIKPYTKFDENGFSYTMTYCDDAKVQIPTFTFKWMASSGVHQFLQKVHQASLDRDRKVEDTAFTKFETPSNNLFNNVQ